MSPNEIFLSVIVCTFNRSQLLRRCLDSLANQNVCSGRYEVIVVDNGSTDDTAVITSHYLKRYDHFHSFRENRLGLSNARNRGWKEAQGGFVAYIDDDAVAYPDWVSSIMDFLGSHPEAGIFGGPYDGYTLVAKPEWFPPEYGTLNLGEREKIINLGPEWVSGSNMIIRRELFSLYGGFNESLGMAGSKIAYGEEINLFFQMHQQGVQIFYVPSIKVSHLIAGYKMSLRWLLASAYAAGRQYEAIFRVKKPFFSHVATLVLTVGMAGCGLLRPVTMPFKRRLYYSFAKFFCQLGSVVESAHSSFKSR